MTDLIDLVQQFAVPRKMMENADLQLLRLKLAPRSREHRKGERKDGLFFIKGADLIRSQ